MPRRAFRNGVSGGRHFGGVIHCSWTRASPIAASGQGWVRPPCALAESTINRSARPTRHPLADRRHRSNPSWRYKGK